MSISSATPLGHRSIIIPEGVLNGDQINVVYIPPSLQNATTPLYVRRASNRMLRAYSLPLWNDDWSGNKPPPSHIEASYRECSGETTENVTEYYTGINHTPRPPTRTRGVTADSRKACNTTYTSNPRSRFKDPYRMGIPIQYVSSKNATISNIRPPEGKSLVVDATKGIDLHSLGGILQDVGSFSSFNSGFASPDTDYGSFQPPYYNSSPLPMDMPDRSPFRYPHDPSPAEWSEQQSEENFGFQIDSMSTMPRCVRRDMNNQTSEGSVYMTRRYDKMTPSPPPQRSAQNATVTRGVPRILCQDSSENESCCKGACSSNKSKAGNQTFDTSSASPCCGRSKKSNSPAQVTRVGGTPYTSSGGYSRVPYSPAVATYGGDNQTFDASYASSGCSSACSRPQSPAVATYGGDNQTFDNSFSSRRNDTAPTGGRCPGAASRGNRTT